jgi:hypothetical protein
MHTTRHTPGPWHIGVCRPISYKFIYGPSGEAVADCDHKTNSPGENLANARLIAAAPELLSALQALVDCPDYRGIGTYEMRQARLALAKVNA